MNEITKLLLSGVLGGIIGGLVGAFAAHKFTDSRETRGRKRAFTGFVRGWRAEIASPTPGPGGFGIGGSPLVNSYLAKLPSYHNEVERVRDAFSDSERFKTLTERVGSINKQEWSSKEAKEIFLAALDELLEFLG